MKRNASTRILALLLCAVWALSAAATPACAPAGQPEPTAKQPETAAQAAPTPEPTPTPVPLGIYVDSDVTADTVWPADDYYICLTADGRAPAVASGAALTIESGANVYLSADGAALPGGVQPAAELTVSGALSAEGVAFAPVPGREAAGWNGIRADSATLALSGSTFAGMLGSAISVAGGTLNMTACTFDGGSAYPVAVTGGACINRDITDAGNGFAEGYPEQYRYIAATRDIDGSAIWGNAGMPYLIADEVNVLAGAGKLQVQPGVTVCFAGHRLNIQGALLAEGTPEAPIGFVRGPGAAAGGELYAGEGFAGSILLKHCVLDGLDRAIHVEGAGGAPGEIPILLEHCAIQNPAHGVRIAGTSIPVRFQNCSILAGADSADDGVLLERAQFVILQNCLVAGFPRYGVAVHDNAAATADAGAPLLENCTVANNGRVGVLFAAGGGTAYGAIVRNCILAQNGVMDLARAQRAEGEVTMEDGSIAYTLLGNYDKLFTGRPALYTDADSGDVFARIPNDAYQVRIGKDPRFADAENGDYHLLSAAGRWDGNDWVKDKVTSPGVDAGDRRSDYALEPDPNGGRINIGCYGNTPEASKSPPKPKPAPKADTPSGGGDSGDSGGSGGGIVYE